MSLRQRPHPNSKRERGKRTLVETGRVGVGGRFQKEDKKWGEMRWATEGCLGGARILRSWVTPAGPDSL